MILKITPKTTNVINTAKLVMHFNSIIDPVKHNATAIAIIDNDQKIITNPNIVANVSCFSANFISDTSKYKLRFHYATCKKC